MRVPSAWHCTYCSLWGWWATHTDAVISSLAFTGRLKMCFFERNAARQSILQTSSIDMQYLNCAVTSELSQQENISLEQYDVDMVTALPDKSGRYLLCTVQSYHTQQLSGVDHYDCIAPLHFSAGYLEYEGQHTLQSSINRNTPSTLINALAQSYRPSATAEGLNHGVVPSISIRHW